MLWAARDSRGSMLRSEAYSGRMANGSSTWAMPMTTPVSLYMSRRGSSITRSQRRTLFSTPLFWSSTIHA